MPAYGPDVSDWQDDIPPCDFVLIKATEGRTFTADSFADKRGYAEGHNLPRFFYHFARAAQGFPKTEAFHFCDVVSQLAPNEGLALDYEAPASTSEAADWHAMSPDQHQDWVLQWLDAVETRYPELVGKILFYTSIGTLPAITTSLIMPRMPLWVAGYGRNDGNEHPQTVFGTTIIPCPVDRWPRYTLWQYTSSPIDWNRAESIDDVLALTVSGQPLPAPAPPLPTTSTTEVEMILVTHQQAVYLVLANGRVVGGLEPADVDALVAAGLKVGGNWGDDRSKFFALLAQTS